MSVKRRKEQPARREVVARVLERDGHKCHWWAFRARQPDLLPADEQPQCWGPLDVHEIVPRSAWRDGYLVDDNCVTLCRLHHDWVGDNPAHAHAMGLHGYSYERPVKTQAETETESAA